MFHYPSWAKQPLPPNRRLFSWRSLPLAVLALRERSLLGGLLQWKDRFLRKSMPVASTQGPGRCCLIPPDLQELRVPLPQIGKLASHMGLPRLCAAPGATVRAVNATAGRNAAQAVKGRSGRRGSRWF